MAKPFSVVVTDPINVDLNVFRYWLQGFNVTKATRERLQHEPEVTKLFKDYSHLLHSETEEMYKRFHSIEPYLHSPTTFLNQSVYQIPLPIRHRMIELYYTFDDAVVREFLGRKLSGKNRRDLDDVSDKTNVSLKSCQRQFDNIKRVLKVVDDFEGSLVENVKRHFHLPEQLSQSYASLVFVSHNRFDTGKKKLSHLTVDDFTKCANLMIEMWTQGSVESHRLVDDDLELDKDFLQDLHDLKLNLIDRVWVEYHQKYVLRDLKRKHAAPWFIRSVESNFKVISRNLITIGSSLIHSKDLKDFFIDITEKIIEPFMQLKWSSEDVDLLLCSIMETFSDCETGHLKHGRSQTKDRKKWSDVYIRYLAVLKQCVLILYHH